MQIPRKKAGNPIDKLLVFETLFDLYYDSLRAYAYKKVNDWAAAEDVVQDVFLALWIRRDQVDFNESLKSYLYKAVYNRSVTYLDSRHYLCNLEALKPEILLNQEIISYNQQDSFLLKEISGEIIRGIEKLPPQCRKVFTLSRRENLKNKEIASQLQISEKTVEDHIRKALKELRSYLMRIK